MVRQKTLTACGPRDGDGHHNNAHISLNREEFEAVGLDVGDEVQVRVVDGELRLVPVDQKRAKPF